MLKSTFAFGQKTILIAVISIILYLIYLWLVSEQTQTENKRKAGIGCPVVFNDKPDFQGAFRCFDIGSIAHLHLPGTGMYVSNGGKQIARKIPYSFDADGTVSSYSIRIGYHLTAFSEPNFKGEVLINKRGPYERTYSNTSSEPLSFACKKKEIRTGECIREPSHSKAPKPKSIRITLAS